MSINAEDPRAPKKCPWVDARYWAKRPWRMSAMDRGLRLLLNSVEAYEDDVADSFDTSFDIFGCVVRDGDSVVLRDPYQLSPPPYSPHLSTPRLSDIVHVVDMAEGDRSRLIEGEIYVGACEIVSMRSVKRWALRWRDAVSVKRSAADLISAGLLIRREHLPKVFLPILAKFLEPRLSTCQYWSNARSLWWSNFMMRWRSVFMREVEPGAAPGATSWKNCPLVKVQCFCCRWIGRVLPPWYEAECVHGCSDLGAVLRLVNAIHPERGGSPLPRPIRDRAPALRRPGTVRVARHPPPQAEHEDMLQRPAEEVPYQKA